MKNEELYGWVFTYNTYTKNWHVTDRDNYHKLFSDTFHGNVLRSKDINTLIEIIIKNKGDINKILKFKESI